MDKAFELIQLYKATVLEKSPNNFYSCNLGGGLKESGLDQWRLTREASWYTADNQSRSGVVAPVWQDAQQVKFARALMGDRSVAAGECKLRTLRQNLVAPGNGYFGGAFVSHGADRSGGRHCLVSLARVGAGI